MNNLTMENNMKLKRITPKGFIARENSYSTFSSSPYEYLVVGTDIKIFEQAGLWKAVSSNVRLASWSFKEIKRKVAKELSNGE